jgi:hypothetical protein
VKNPFDIFWFGENGPNWIVAVDSLEAAQAQIAKLPQGPSGSYAVLDQRTGNRMSFAAKLQASGARTQPAQPPQAKSRTTAP